MTGKEFDQMLYLIDWSNKDAAEKLGITERTIRNYLNEKRKIPLIVERFLALQIEHNKLLEQCTKS